MSDKPTATSGTLTPLGEALELAERWKDIRTDESYGPQGKWLGLLSRELLYLYSSLQSAKAQTNAAPQGQAVPEIRVREREEAGASPAVAAPLSSAAPSAAQLIVTPEMVKAGSKAIDDYYHGTKDAPFEGSVEACYRAMRVLESSALSSGGEKIADLKRQLAAEREHGQNLQSLLDDTRRANESLRSTTVPSSATENIERLVDRFLNWPLPASVCSDLCVTRIDYPHQRIGTNLLTADEARQMLEYVLAESSTQSANAATIPPKMPRLSLNDPDYDGEQDIYNQGWNACRQAMSNSADSGDEEPRGDKHE